MAHSQKQNAKRNKGNQSDIIGNQHAAEKDTGKSEAEQPSVLSLHAGEDWCQASQIRHIPAGPRQSASDRTAGSEYENPDSQDTVDREDRKRQESTARKKEDGKHCIFL